FASCRDLHTEKETSLGMKTRNHLDLSCLMAFMPVTESTKAVGPSLTVQHNEFIIGRFIDNPTAP
ncbi:MAG: hypothetical protein FWH27_07990, partial [Planctomycetaceae bacterium]|nr:hypothetical protein [Planctomycetaceae bacterium]